MPKDTSSNKPSTSLQTQKYGRLSVSVQQQANQEDNVPQSTFSFQNKKKKKDEKKKDEKKDVGKKKDKKKTKASQAGSQAPPFSLNECFNLIFKSKCRKKKPPQQQTLKKQPEHKKDITFPQYAGHLARSNRKFLLSHMEGLTPYDVEKHCWREWSVNRINRILSTHHFNPATDKSQIYKPPRFQEIEVVKMYKTGLYLEDGWLDWAKMRYPNGLRPYGPRLP